MYVNKAIKVSRILWSLKLWESIVLDDDAGLAELFLSAKILSFKHPKVFLMWVPGPHHSKSQVQTLAMGLLYDTKGYLPSISIIANWREVYKRNI